MRDSCVTGAHPSFCCRKACTGDTFPTTCNDDCAGLWMPIWADCGARLSEMFAVRIKDRAGVWWSRNLKSTGLTQNLGQLQGSYGDFQSNCWVNLRILGQPCDFYLLDALDDRILASVWGAARLPADVRLGRSACPSATPLGYCGPLRQVAAGMRWRGRASAGERLTALIPSATALR